MTDEEIRRMLARKSESANLDYKAGFAWTKDNRDKKYKLIRDLMGMGNTKDGGRVILGVSDGEFEFVGLLDEVYESIDPSNVVQMLHDNSSPKVKCEVLKRVIDGRKLIVLDVAEFYDTPIICTNTITSTEGKPRTILREAAIYVRTPAAATEEVSSPDEMRSLLGRAIAKKGDELLHSIQRLIMGKAAPVGPTSRELYEPELKAAHKFLAEQLGKELQEHGYVEVVAYPTTYDPKRIRTIPEARALIERSEVNLRGWNFPHTDKEQAGAFAEGAESSTIRDRYREGYRLYRSGLYVWNRVYWEDTQGRQSKSGKKALSFVSAIWSFTEYLLFLARLYEMVAPDASVYVQITLHGCKDRELAAFDPEVTWWEGNVSREGVISQAENLQVVELRASHLDVAAKMVKHVFHVFNWADVQDKVIANWQQKLLRREF
jgi:hypothetical protein